MVKSPLPSVPGFSVYASAAHAWWALRPTIPTATQETQVERRNLDCNMDKGLEHLGEDSSGKWNSVRQMTTACRGEGNRRVIQIEISRCGFSLGLFRPSDHLRAFGRSKGHVRFRVQR